MKIQTPEKYILDLQWDREILNQCEAFLIEWDKKKDFYYKNCSKIAKKVDLAEREHLRNCIKFWKKRLNETQSS